MRIVTAAVSLLLLLPASGLAGTDPLHESGSHAGAGSHAAATAPPADVGLASAMPRNAALRLYALRPEWLMAALVGPLLFASVVLAIGMLRDAGRDRRRPRP